MADKSFEQTARGQMEDFRIRPSDAVWTAVEARLRQRRKRRRFIFFLLLPLIAAGGLLLGRHWNPAAPSSAQQAVVRPSNSATTPAPAQDQPAAAHPLPAQTGISSAPTNTGGTDISQADDLLTNKKNQQDVNTSATPLSTNPAAANASQRLAGQQKSKQSGTDPVVNFLPPANDNCSRKKTAVKNNDGTGINATVGNPVRDHQDHQTDEGNTALTQALVQRPDSTSQQTASPVVDAKKDSAALTLLTGDKKADSLQSHPALQKYTDRIRKNRPWRFGISVTAGRASETDLLKLNQAGSEKMDINAFGAGNSPFPTTVTQIGTNPQPALGLGFGLTAEKQVSARSRVQLGLNYLMLKNKYRTGGAIDSVERLFITNPVTGPYGNLLSYNTVEVTRSYAAGNSNIYSGTYHWLELPVSFHTRITRIGKTGLFGYAGASYSVLLKSNALVYDETQHIYVSGESLFRRSQFSALAGIALRAGEQGPRPFSVGPFVRYGLSSTTSDYLSDRKSLLYFGLKLDWMLWRR
jgi:Outer membrane protein beta-barrel domain